MTAAMSASAAVHVTALMVQRRRLRTMVRLYRRFHKRDCREARHEWFEATREWNDECMTRAAMEVPYATWLASFAGLPVGETVMA